MPGLNLTRAEAIERKNTVNPHSYVVNLDLTTGDRVFLSTTTINFSADVGSETFVDLVSDHIHSIDLNGRNLPTTVHRDHRIHLSGLDAENTLVVQADCNYMHTGEGLHSFIDPADGLRYCYSQFEVPDARRVFATFEQPDLKAHFEFSVTTPADWTVFSNETTPEPVEVPQGLRFDFAATQQIPTYITAIVAGPYVGRTSSVQSSDGREIPLGVYCRRSLFDHLDSENIFEVTRQGFAFFEQAYQIPYPFNKYDQIFVPEYNAGAMENAGCVTFRDQYLFRSKPTAWELEARSNTILHELAHMWFGNLVTMQWWNDLWLNESFAEYMSHLALAEATEWTDAWIGFISRKEWGLSQDQLPSTHPIKADIRDLQDVEVNFDGITYAKGASVLRQLVSYVGRQNFFEGLHQYLTKHAWGNATLQDLLNELENASGRDLSRWSNVWLEEAGVTTLRPLIETDNEDKFSKVAVIQEAFTPGASMRPHRLIIGGYELGDDDEQVVRTFSYEVDIDHDWTEVTELTGVRRPDLLLVNDGDLAYAKIRLDDDSLAFALANIHLIPDAVTRRTILSAAWDMTRDGELSAGTYVTLALQAVPVEDNISTLTSILARISFAVNRFSAPALRAARQVETADALAFSAKAAPAGSDQQRMLVRAFAQSAVTPAQLELVSGLLTESIPLNGLDVDVDLQWSLLMALVRGGLAGKSEIEAQKAKDPTLTGEQRAQQGLATIDSAETRTQTWQKVLHDLDIPNDTLWAMLAGFWAHAATSPSEYVSYAEDFFNQIVPVWESHTFHIASRLIEEAFPLRLSGYWPGLDIVALAQEWLDTNLDQPDSLRRLILEGQADAARMVLVQATELQVE